MSATTVARSVSQQLANGLGTDNLFALAKLCHRLAASEPENRIALTLLADAFYGLADGWQHRPLDADAVSRIHDSLIPVLDPALLGGDDVATLRPLVDALNAARAVDPVVRR